MMHLAKAGFRVHCAVCDKTCSRWVLEWSDYIMDGCCVRVYCHGEFEEIFLSYDQMQNIETLVSSTAFLKMLNLTDKGGGDGRSVDAS